MIDWLELVLETIIMALGVWLTYSAWRAYQRSKDVNLKIISIVFFSFGVIYLVSVISLAIWILGGKSESLAIIETIHDTVEGIGLIIALFFLVRAIRLQPRWRKPLEKKPLPERST